MVCQGNPDDPGGISCKDPCAGKLPPLPPGSLDKKILFYAPANYHYGVNLYANAVKTELGKLGYKITLVTSVNEGVKFDECNLYRQFRQIWLYMPCNNQQRMDQASFDALKKYYTYGGGIVLFTDDHYYSQANPNTHCTQTDFAGTTTVPSDAVRVAKEILAINVEFTSLNATPPTVNTTHPLAAVMQMLKGGISWQQFQINPLGNPDLKFLPLTAGTKTGRWAGLIEVNKVNPDKAALDTKRLALVLTPTYCYHCQPSTTYNFIPFYDGIASYFDKHVADTEKKTSSAGSGTPFGQGMEARPEVGPGPSVEFLLGRLHDSDHHAVGEAVSGLAALGAIDFDRVIPYFEHERFYVRHHAVLAMSHLPPSTTIFRLLAELGKAQSKHRLMGIVRSLGAHQAPEALLPLLQLAEDPQQPVEVRREILIAIGGLGSRAAVKPLLLLYPSLGGTLQDTVRRSLAEISAR